jgi:hypothetical protein
MLCRAAYPRNLARKGGSMLMEVSGLQKEGTKDTPVTSDAPQGWWMSERG